MATQIQPPVLVPLPYRRWTATSDQPPNLSVAVLIAQGQQIGGNRPGSVQMTNPQVRRWTQTPDPIANPLITTLSFIQLSTPVIQNDWPAPVKSRFFGSTDQVVNYLALGIVVPPTQQVNPTYGQAFKTRIGSPQDPPNLLTTTIPFVATVPFGLYDWPAVRRSAWQADTTITNPTISLPVPSVLPGAVTFTANFKRVVLENFDPPNTLVSAPANVVPFSLTDWPQVYRPKFLGSVVFHRPETARAQSPGTTGTPFFQNDFPGPFKASYSWDPQPPPNTCLLLSQPVVLPASFDSRTSNAPSAVPKPIDIPNTIGLLSLPNPQPVPTLPQPQVFSRWINAVDPVTNQLPLGFTLPPAPFAQLDWPPPFKIRIEPIDAPANLSTLSFVNVKPFNLSDWPPPQPRGRVTDLPPPNLLCTLQFVSPPVPFNQFDWPQVYRRPFTGAITDLLNPFTSVTLPNPVPFNQLDWPQPFRARWDVWVDQLADSPLVTISPTPTPPIPPIPGSGLGREGGSVILQPKKQGETLILAFDFISILGQGEILSSAKVICTVYSGNDSNPQAMIPTTASVAGTQILQEITGGVVGTVYELLCVATTSLARTPEISAYYVVEPDLA